jgi:molybdate/tungstate transport system substrate-binding protein
MRSGHRSGGLLPADSHDCAGAPKPRRRFRRVLALPAAGLLAAALSSLPMRPAAAAGAVNVLYAGSLVNLMEHGVGPAFDKATGSQFQGYAGGSVGLANQIKGKLRKGDVFISANSKVNAGLSGAANGDWVSWYIAFAQSPVVIGYSASSKFAADFRSKPWYQVLVEPGIKIGRTDAKLDPKGALTLALMKQAETFYDSPDLAQKVLGAPDNPAQVLPEETLVGRLQSGQLDAGFFYSTETADAKIPAISLPPAIAPKAVYTVTILHDAPNAAGADQFVAFLLGPDGQDLLKEHGLTVQKMDVSGDANAVPQDIKAIVDKAK